MKVAIAGGGGGVGSSVAFNLLLCEHPYEVVLLDRRAEMLSSHAMDLEQVLEQGASGSVRAGDDADLSDADVFIAAASAPLTVNTSRMVYLEDNAAILGDLLRRLPASWPGILIVVANPVDALCSWARARTDIPRERLLGYTLNDSLRLRSGIAAAIGAQPGAVEAWVIGEHGDRGVPLFDRVLVDGEPREIDRAARAAAEDFLRGWYERHVALDSGRSSTWTSGLGLARMIDAIRADRGELWPASLWLEGEYGVSGVSLGVPVELSRMGVRAIRQWALDPVEREAFKAGAEAVREAVVGLGGERAAQAAVLTGSEGLAT
jgi:malate dehydrogenase